MSASQQTALPTFTCRKMFAKECGRGKEQKKPDIDGLQEVWPKEETHKSTVGIEIEELPGTHRTVVCLTADNDINAVAAALEEIGDVSGVETKVAGFTQFGPNTVLLLMDDVEFGKKMQKADAAGTKEGKGVARLPHVTVPVEPERDDNGNIKKDDNGKIVWKKRFPDVSDEKFERCVSILNHPGLRNFVGMTDDEMLHEIAPYVFDE